MDLERVEYWKSLINMSLSKFLILQTLHQEPCHGYAILERLKQLSGDCCTPTYRRDLSRAEAAHTRGLRHGQVRDRARSRHEGSTS